MHRTHYLHGYHGVAPLVALITRLIGREPLITFVTFGELAKWALTWSVRVQVMACGPPSMTTSCMSLIKPGSRWLLLVLVSGLRGG